MEPSERRHFIDLPVFDNAHDALKFALHLWENTGYMYESLVPLLAEHIGETEQFVRSIGLIIPSSMTCEAFPAAAVRLQTILQASQTARKKPV